jgi:hypothetical protein
VPLMLAQQPNSRAPLRSGNRQLRAQRHAKLRSESAGAPTGEKSHRSNRGDRLTRSGPTYTAFCTKCLLRRFDQAANFLLIGGKRSTGDSAGCAAGSVRLSALRRHPELRVRVTMLLQLAPRGVMSALRQIPAEGVRRCERPLPTPACSKAAIPLSAQPSH